MPYQAILPGLQPGFYAAETGIPGQPQSRLPAEFQGVMAMTRRGLPEPPTIFSGAAMTMAPVGGS